MDDPTVMRKSDRIAGFAEDLDQTPERQAPPVAFHATFRVEMANGLLEGLSSYFLHGEVRLTIGKHPHIMDRWDPRMLELTRHQGFLNEALALPGIGMALGPKLLERHLAAEVAIENPTQIAVAKRANIIGWSVLKP